MVRKLRSTEIMPGMCLGKVKLFTTELKALFKTIALICLVDLQAESVAGLISLK